jgi:hypothetical protein
MRKIVMILIAVAGCIVHLHGANKPKFHFSKGGGYAKVATPVAWAKIIQQGFGMRMYMCNQGFLGNQATRSGTAIGLDYPAGSNTEHLFGGGPIIGGIWNGQRRVSSGYWEGAQEFIPELKDSGRDRMWIAVASDTAYDPNRPGYYKRGMSIRLVDDDGDGKLDEDELDGMDNDGDWNPLTDDIGADGIPDSLEVGCRGAYDPVNNPDPAFDNYSPGKTDLCHQNLDGSSPRKNDKDKYTEHNGLTDHGEPHVDEDFAAISDHDVYFAATDTLRDPPGFGASLPLGIKLWQKSYAWQGKLLQAILPIDYFFVNVGNTILRDVYLGWEADMDVGPVAVGSYATDNYSAYIPNIHTSYVHNAIERGATPLGVTILGTSRPLDSLNFVYHWYFAGNTVSSDSLQYGWLNCEAFGGNCITPDQPPSTPGDMRIFTSCGPFPEMKPGDTLRLSIALVSGDGITAGVNPMSDNAKTAIRLFNSGFSQPARAVSPCLEIVPGFKKVSLKWGRDVLCPNGRPGEDPTAIWDDSNSVAESFPPDHWRRVNPPQGHIHGGRIFEGYRLYRSEDFTGSPTSFTLLKQFDIIDEFSYNLGLDTSYVDSNLVRGKRYWYSVTSFGIRNRTIITSSPSPGVVLRDTLYASEPESPLESNSQSVDLPFSASDKLGEVLVVPNPYRTDLDYTTENGGWEGLGRDWTENRRKVKFIHLPRKCTIRVFTLAGDQVATLFYDAHQQAVIQQDVQVENKGEIDWNLVSDSNRALASGVYVFSVESDLGQQIGKFVLIR